MAKEKEPLLGGEEEFVKISKTELEALKQGKTDIEMLANSLAFAIQESRKPYVSPEQQQNEEAARSSMKMQGEAQRRQKKWDQDNCPHIMACNPLSSTRDMFNRASFIKHRLDTGVEVLLCTNCQKVVWPDDPEYIKFYNAHTTNQPSSAGNRYFPDIPGAMKLGRL